MIGKRVRAMERSYTTGNKTVTMKVGTVKSQELYGARICVVTWDFGCEEKRNPASICPEEIPPQDLGYSDIEYLWSEQRFNRVPPVQEKYSRETSGLRTWAANRDREND